MQSTRNLDTSQLPALRPTFESSKFIDFQREIENLKKENSELKKENQHLRKQETDSIKAELQYKNLLRNYQQELKIQSLQHKMPTEDSEKNAGLITETYDKVYDCIKNLQNKVDEILMAKEDTLVAVFNSKIEEISRDLEKQKKEKLEYIESLAEREGKSARELEILKGSIQLIESKNAFLEKENKKIKFELKQVRSEYEILESRLFELKKKKSNASSSRMQISTTSPASVGISPPISPNLSMRKKSFHNMSDELSSSKYQIVIEKLQNSLKLQKNDLRAARTAYIRQLQTKTELSQVLQVCIDEVKKQISESKSVKKINTIKQELITRLTSQQEILSLIYERVNN